MNPEYKETIGVNETIRKPPIIENVNDLDSMARLEGQMMGRLGDTKRSWYLILMMWVSFGGPVLIFVGIAIFSRSVDLPIWAKVIISAFTLSIGILAHIPVYQAIRVKFRD